MDNERYRLLDGLAITPRFNVFRRWFTSEVPYFSRDSHLNLMSPSAGCDDVMLWIVSDLFSINTHNINAGPVAVQLCLGAFESCLPKIIKIGFSAINLIYFFTAGPDEVKCWQIRRQTKAPQAAGTIHTDFERGFICAEVMKFDDLKELNKTLFVKFAKYISNWETSAKLSPNLILPNLLTLDIDWFEFKEFEYDTTSAIFEGQTFRSLR
ncbi:hypothetical protein D5086_004581 [Populus alba]|uniref:Uncharacterized protein n=1 Tax=Populus alba TaxID=43335 RepID=A0ACC4CS81_POPAL